MPVSTIETLRHARLTAVMTDAGKYFRTSRYTRTPWHLRNWRDEIKPDGYPISEMREKYIHILVKRTRPDASDGNELV